MSDYINRADKVIEHVLSRHGGHGTYLDAARALDDAGLLATPEHDAAVAAKALREAAEMWSIEDYIETALSGLNYVRGRLIEHADHILDESNFR